MLNCRKSFSEFGASGRPDDSYLDPRLQDILDLDERISGGKAYEVMNDPHMSRVINRIGASEQCIREVFYPGFDRLFIDRREVNGS